MLEVINSKYEKYSVGSIRINGEWTYVRRILPTKTVFGTWILPGSYCWKYKHTAMCMDGKQGTGFYYKWINLFLTGEEYVMVKLG